MQGVKENALNKSKKTTIRVAKQTKHTFDDGEKILKN